MTVRSSAFQSCEDCGNYWLLSDVTYVTLTYSSLVVLHVVVSVHLRSFNYALSLAAVTFVTLLSCSATTTIPCRLMSASTRVDLTRGSPPRYFRLMVPLKSGEKAYLDVTPRYTPCEYRLHLVRRTLRSFDGPFTAPSIQEMDSTDLCRDHLVSDLHTYFYFAC